MKFLMKKVNENKEKFSDALLEFRNTPNISGRSPNQMFFGRRLRGALPHLPGANDLDLENAISGAEQRKQLMETETKSGTPLKKLQTGQRVLIQNPQTKAWDEKCKILGIRPTGRSYDVLFDNGKTSIRNRAFLRPINWKPPDDDNQPNENESNKDMTDDLHHNKMKENVEPRRSERIKKLHL